ncbi:hypothetical protein I7I51_04052 [Histoplasma capsulatum]|uniref:Uncharacterized protein n=1 Tax=Ajellomyces capsulatus TaxID=5037 RepID=A0A8A1M823_AJECA|nr:hypothetical protein I7I51_04052 [Histoplasma capsulatum]
MRGREPSRKTPNANSQCSKHSSSAQLQVLMVKMWLLLVLIGVNNPLQSATVGHYSRKNLASNFRFVCKKTGSSTRPFDFKELRVPKSADYSLRAKVFNSQEIGSKNRRGCSSSKVNNSRVPSWQADKSRGRHPLRLRLADGDCGHMSRNQEALIVARVARTNTAYASLWASCTELCMRYSGLDT